MAAKPPMPKKTGSTPKNPSAVTPAIAKPAPKPRRAKVTAPAVPPMPRPKPVPVLRASAEELDKSKKHGLVRDSFKFPHEEYAALDALKARCLRAGEAVKKGELVRAGLFALQALSDQQLLEVLGKVEKLKAGRPAQ
jgi:hypothetical protein